MKAKTTDTLELVKNCCRALDDKKAGDVRVLDVHEQSSVTDFMVVATATSEPHLRALRIEVEKVLDAAKAPIVGMDTDQMSGWMVIDGFDLMIHLFLAEQRKKYGLENLWKDGVELSVAKLLAPPKEVAKKKVAVPAKKAVPTKKKAVVKKTAAVKKKTTVTKKTVAKKKTVSVAKKKPATKPKAK